MSASGTDLEQSRAALAAAAARTAALVATIDAPCRPTAGLDWTLSETAAHLVMGLRLYADSVCGDLERWRAYIPDLPGFRDRLVAVTTGTLAEVPERDPVTLGRLLREAADGFLSASAGLPAGHPVSTPWYGDGETLDLGDATALLLGEQLVHGRDLALSLRHPWPISRAEALMVVPAAAAMMPKAIRVEATRDLDLTFAFHLRGGPDFAVRVARGAAHLEARALRPADCHLNFDPQSFLLVGYGRMTPWAAVARGGALAYGRRPWLAFRFKSMFHDP